MFFERYNGVGNGFDDGEFELVLALDEDYGVYETIAGNKDGSWESFNTKVSAISDFMDSSDPIYYSIMVEAAGDRINIKLFALKKNDSVLVESSTLPSPSSQSQTMWTPQHLKMTKTRLHVTKSCSPTNARYQP